MENSEPATPGRRTRSRSTKASPAAKVEKPATRKTRKKVLMEVDVSEEEEETVGEQKSAHEEEPEESVKEASPSRKKRKVSVDEVKNGDEETHNVGEILTHKVDVPVKTEANEHPKTKENVENTELKRDSDALAGTEDKTNMDKIEVDQKPMEVTKINEEIKMEVDQAAIESHGKEIGSELKKDKLVKDCKSEIKDEPKPQMKKENTEQDEKAGKSTPVIKNEDSVEKENSHKKIENCEVKEEKVKIKDVKCEKNDTTQKTDVQDKKNEAIEKSVVKDLKTDTTENSDDKDEKSETVLKSDFKENAEKLETEDNKDSAKEKKTEAKPTVDPDAENISEDELPGVPVVKVPEAEEVSDDELPEPKRAELPADTEVVSEDELPTVKSDKKELKKRKLDQTGYDPGSPTSENELPSKKIATDSSAEKDKEEKSPKPKKLPELDKYWKAVNDDPTDFTGWTYLLQYVDQENDMEAAREAYDAFLSHYPYCYGYWRKYADYEKRKGNKKRCEEVFERGLKAIPLSVDLWLHYLTYVKTARTEEDYVRSQFERALAACGLEFRSDRLWDSYIKWETDGKRLQRVTGIYDKLLATPTQGYTTHFDSFQEHIASNPPYKVIEVDEFLALRKEVRHMLKHDVTSDPGAKDKEESDAPPGDEEPSKMASSDEETKAIRERIVSIRRKVHKATVNAVASRWNYEEGIKRPYFHVKPLERCQLKNWHDYIDYETAQGDKVRIIVLFERCLIACALYEEFWLKFVHYLEGLKDTDMQSKIRDVYERACTIHHLKKPNLHLQWAMFEEVVGNLPRAAEILVNLEKSLPNILQIAYRRINLERRRSDFEKCTQLFEHYMNNSKNKMVSSNVAIKYARFCLKVLKDLTKAQEVLKAAIAKDTNNPRLYLQLVDLTVQKENVTPSEVIEIIDLFLNKDSTDSEQKVLFAQRKLEYLEDFGNDIQSVQQAYEAYQKYLKMNKENTKKKEVKSDTTTPPKSEKGATPTTTQSGSYGNYGSYNSNTQQAQYAYSGTQQGQYNYSQYGQGDQYQYPNWQYPQGGYGGYNQWGGYGGGYSY